MFPFTYENVEYDRCTKNYNDDPNDDYDVPWCYDERGNENWAYCTDCRYEGKDNVFIVSQYKCGKNL